MAITKVLIERIWVLQMKSAVPSMPVAEHALAARTVDAQFLGAVGDGVVVLLQFVFGVAGGHEALDALALREELDAGADDDRQHHHQEHRPRQHRQVTHAAEGHGQGNGQRREGEGEVADGVDVVGQHRDQAVAAIAFDLFDGRRQHLFAQLFAQLGDDVLADIVGADVRADRTDQRQQAQAGEQRDHALGQAAFGECRALLIVASSTVTLRPPTMPRMIDRLTTSRNGFSRVNNS